MKIKGTLSGFILNQLATKNRTSRELINLYASIRHMEGWDFYAINRCTESLRKKENLLKKEGLIDPIGSERLGRSKSVLYRITEEGRRKLNHN